MRPAVISSTIALALVGVLAICGVRVCGIAISRWRRGRNAVAWKSRRPVPWSGVDLLLFLAVFLAVTLTLPQLLIARRDELQPSYLISFALAELLGCALGAAAVAYSSAATSRDFGWRWRGWTRDMALGWALFAALSVPLFSLQFVLNSLFEPKPHPLVDFLQETRTPSALIASILTAIVAAPVVEEFFFRVLLQGWLERLATVQSRSSATTPAPQDVPQAAEEVTRPALNLDDDSWRPPALGHDRASDVVPTVRASRAAWPIAVSAALFALAHWNHGTDPIPLFGLGMGLGYAYRQTHRLLPCVVLHACINTFSLLMIWLN